MKTACIVMTAAMLGMGPVVKAGMINVSLSDNASPTLSGPAGAAGTTWNTWRAPAIALKDSAGNDTSVNFTADGAGPYGNWWCDLGLLTGGVFDNGGGTLPCVISGLDPAKSYDLYLASSYGTSGSNTSFSCSNTTDTASPQTADNRSAKNGSYWMRGQNYVLFQNVTPDSSGRVHLTYGGIDGYGILNGFQVVEKGTAFAAWTAASAQGLSAGLNDGPLDDPDQDGIVNLLEFARGGSPMSYSPEIQPRLVPGIFDNTLTFEYDRNILSIPATQVVEYSYNLADWTPVIIPASSGDHVTIINAMGLFDHVIVSIPAQGSQVFARLKVTR